MFKFIGCGAALYPKLYNSNAYFRLQDDLFLIDCGETAFRRHYIYGNFEGVKSVTVFITHMHTDHIGSLGTLIVYVYLKLGIRTTVIYKEPEKLKTVFDFTGVEPEHYCLYENYSVMNDPRIKEEVIQVRHHDKMVNSYGYLFDIEGKKLYYSGDAAEIPDCIVEKIKNGELDQVYQDTAVHAHGNCHLTLEELEKKIETQYRRKVFCMHYDSECFEQIREKGFQTIETKVVGYHQDGGDPNV